MSNIFGSLTAIIFLVFWAVLMGLSVFCLVDALRHRPDAFVAAGKRSKNIWLAVLGVAVALSLVSYPYPFQLTGILAAVGAGVYAADVRPALRQVMGRGSSNDGPTGRW
jgi:Protein of unknown function (DUF2516)